MTETSQSSKPQPPDAWLAEQEPGRDVGVERIAAIYAQALLDVAEKSGRAADLLEEFDSLVRDVFGALSDLERVLGSGLVSHEEKVQMLDRALGSQASREFLNFLKVLSRHGRLDILRAIHREARQQYERRLGRVHVTVITAAPLDDQLADHIAQQLRGMLDGEPVLYRVVDPSVIGGLVVRVDDTVYDGLIATQLKNLRQQMVDRSAHEIQSRRDRFRYSE